VGLWERIRELGSGPKRRILADLADAYGHELRLAQQLSVHAERVPYPADAAALLGLAEREDAHATAVRQHIERLGAVAPSGDPGAPRSGHNYWERLTVDLEDLRAKSGRYRERALHWDVEDADTAALFERLAHEDTAICRVVSDLITRSDPHAED